MELEEVVAHEGSVFEGSSDRDHRNQVPEDKTENKTQEDRGCRKWDGENRRRLKMSQVLCMNHKFGHLSLQNLFPHP